MKKLILIFAILYSTISYSQWKPVEGLYGGSVKSMISVDNTIYLTAGNQLYSSDDNGANWSTKNFNYQVNFGLDNIILFKNKIYVTSLLDGVYSYDLNNQKWVNIDNGNFNNSNFLELAANDNYIFLSTNHYLFRSQNGTNWEIIDSTITNHICVYENNVVYQSGAHSVFISTNNGNNWSEITPEFLGMEQSKTIHMNEKFIFSSYNGILIRSEDKGKSWETIMNTTIKRIFSFRNILLFADDESIYFSENYGESWSKKIVELNQNNIYSIYYNNGILYLSTDKDIFQSSDKGESWKLCNKGINNINYLFFGINKNKIYTSSYGYGICEIEPKYHTIKQKFFSEQSMGILYNNNNILIALPYYSGGMNISLDSGESWFIPDTSNGFTNKRVRKIEFIDSLIYAATYNGIYVSSDYGKNWNNIKPIYQNTPLNDTLYLDWNIYSIKKINDKLFIGTYNKGLFVSDISNLGIWSKVETNIPEIDDLDKSIIINIFYHNEIIYLKTVEKVFISEDYGKTWREIYTDYNENDLRKFVFYKNKIIISSTNGIYLSTNNNNLLVNVNEGLGSYYINDITIFDNEIYAATSAGVYYRDIDELILSSVEDTEIRNYLYSYPPYPIPAKTQVNTIIYLDKSITMDEESIKIYDINGMEVGRQEDITLEQESAYKGRLIWNCASVPDGVYLIHIKHGNNTKTIKVIVNK